MRIQLILLWRIKRSDSETLNLMRLQVILILLMCVLNAVGSPLLEWASLKMRMEDKAPLLERLLDYTSDRTISNEIGDTYLHLILKSSTWDDVEFSCILLTWKNMKKYVSQKDLLVSNKHGVVVFPFLRDTCRCSNIAIDISDFAPDL